MIDFLKINVLTCKIFNNNAVLIKIFMKVCAKLFFIAILIGRNLVIIFH